MHPNHAPPGTVLLFERKPMVIGLSVGLAIALFVLYNLT